DRPGGRVFPAGPGGGRSARGRGRPAFEAPRSAHGTAAGSAGCSRRPTGCVRSPVMTQHDVTDRPPVHALLADGATVCIRPVRPDDHEQIQRLYEEMSPENLRLRFFSLSRRSARLAADRACGPARPGYRALLAERQGRVIGLAEYETEDGRADQESEAGAGRKTAEVAVAVADGLHHRGVGTLLVEHLVSAARADGITAFTADALSENREVLKLFADLGLRTARRFEGPE